MYMAQKAKKKSKLRHAEYYDMQKTFDSLYADSKSGEVFGHLMDIISAPSNIKLAFRNIKGNDGSHTAGTDGRTIESLAVMPEDKFVKLIQKQFRRYEPKAVKRVEIPKPNGKMRPLGIPCIIDRIVQQCILQVMEPICEAKVSDIDKMKVEEQKKAARSGYDMDILPPDLVTYSNDAKTLLEDLQSRNERMFLLTFLVVNMAPTRRELDNDLFTVSGIVQKYNCTLKRLDFQQEDGFLSSLPLGHNGIEIKRGMTTSSTAIFVPFMTQELRMDGEAVYYGLNALSHNVIMANRKKLKNPNGLFLGVPGSGKSFAAKRELVNVFLATKDRIIVVDPMGEYSPLIRRLGGQVIEIAPDSPHHINPMDIDLSFDEENPMALKADFILSLMELIVGGKDGLQPVERTVIDRCVRQMYREHLQDPETSKMPTLQTLYDLLCSQPEGEAVRLATALEIYVSGSLNVFNHETNVDLNRRLVCLDLKKLGAGLRTIAMLIMQDLVNSQVSMNFLRGIATWCYFDEFHVLLRDRLTASYCVAIWKMLRKKGCVPSALTQNVKDFLASPEIENIFENSDFLVLLSQAQGDRQILAKQLGISPHQLSYVTHTNSGEGLLFFGNTTIPFVDRFPQNTELYAIMTTRPEDKKQEMNRA